MSETDGFRSAVQRAQREFFAANAPPIPSVVINAYIEHLQLDEPEDMRMPWNVGTLRAIAKQEARWRRVFADEMAKELERTL